MRLDESSYPAGTHRNLDAMLLGFYLDRLLGAPGNWRLRGVCLIHQIDDDLERLDVASLLYGLGNNLAALASLRGGFFFCQRREEVFAFKIARLDQHPYRRILEDSRQCPAPLWCWQYRLVVAQIAAKRRLVNRRVMLDAKLRELADQIVVSAALVKVEIAQLITEPVTESQSGLQVYLVVHGLFP